MSKWKCFYDELPTDGATIWIRYPVFSNPFLATWREATQDLETANGLTLPWYATPQWRPQD